MALVYNFNEDVVVVAFISLVEVTNPFYKYLVKNDVTKMRNILVQVQKYIQIEEVTRAASGHPLRQGPKVEKAKPQFPLRKSPSHNSFAVHKPARRATEPSKGVK